MKTQLSKVNRKVAVRTQRATQRRGGETTSRPHTCASFSCKSAHKAEEQPSTFPQGFPAEKGNPNNTQR